MLRIATLAAAVLAAPVSAATLQLDAAGRLEGATGVIVGTGTYTVEFGRFNCDDFNDCQRDWSFKTAQGAEAALNALADQVLTGEFINLNNIASTDGDAATIFIPFETDVQSASRTIWNTMILENTRGYSELEITGFVPISGQRPFDSLGDEAITRFTLTDGVAYTDPIAPVPVPASLPLLAVGLGAFGFMRRR